MRKSIRMYCSSLIFVLSIAKGAILGEWDDPLRDAYRPHRGRHCQPGEHSTKQEGTAYYVDAYRERVYPFHYLGCGGDGNVYVDIPTAEQNLPQESGTCEGFNMTGWPKYDQPGGDGQCPVGSSLIVYGEFSAICCDDHTAEKYRNSKNVICPDGSKPYFVEVAYNLDDSEYPEVRRENRTQFGKWCQDEFCPPDYHCKQAEFEAYCCLTPPTDAPISEEYDESEEKEESEEKSPESEIEPEKNGFYSSIAEYSGVISVLLVGTVVLVFVSLIIVCACTRTRTRTVKGDTRETQALNP